MKNMLSPFWGTLALIYGPKISQIGVSNGPKPTTLGLAV